MAVEYDVRVGAPDACLSFVPCIVAYILQLICLEKELANESTSDCYKMCSIPLEILAQMWCDFPISLLSEELFLCRFACKFIYTSTPTF